MSTHFDLNHRPETDSLIVQIVDYVYTYHIQNTVAMETARHCLMDTIGCGLLALRFPECTKHLGPVVAGTVVPNGARVFGTPYVLDPIKAAWDIGCMVRWLDFNDTWLAAEWGHPSDNLGGILAVADYVNRNHETFGVEKWRMQDVLEAMVKAHEIQGVMALKNSFNRVGLDHVFLVKLASCAVVCKLLGCTKTQAENAVSQVLVDGQALRTYRHAPNTGSRKSWAAGDATSRAVFLAWMSKKGEMGYPAPLTAKKWGFYDVLFKGNAFQLDQAFEAYVMENILFKISFPAEFHAQTAVECAVRLHPLLQGRFADIEKIQLDTHESAVRIISKVGALNNPADRDHCLQYMVAIGLMKGNLVAEDYEDDVAQHPLIDQLREKMHVTEIKSYSEDYLDPQKRSIANAIQVFFKDGSQTEKIEIHYPIGHKNRRKEGIPILEEKFKSNLRVVFTEERAKRIFECFADAKQLSQMSVEKFMNLLVV